MPFGLSIAPYIQQMLLNAVLTFIRKYTRFTYGHLDDLLIAHRDQAKLQVLVNVLRAKLRQAGWVLNTKKSVLNPVKRLTFLGAEWDGLGIRRSQEASKFVRDMSFSLLTNDPKGRALARVRGYLNYYGGFAGKLGPVINTFLRMSLVTRRDYYSYLSLVINIDRLRFKLYPPKQAVRWYTDASEYQLGAVHGRSGDELSMAAPTTSILYNEAAASILPIALSDHPANLHLFIDNQAVIGLWKRVRAKWERFYTAGPDNMHRFLSLIIYVNWARTVFNLYHN
ncbi:Retrovirus-related Pol poly from transposon opus [Brachionus plicatilis]|uniref:Retrovirus-related Pol poly from transposon opus n=1 Tax=Brachionus plicatilis TaxID=10195 RepID=A0A3M7RRJ1_BRAPC|nr:Retrovirus-related Pol poly from transposon opus [Brachionus plicatilis]